MKAVPVNESVGGYQELTGFKRFRGNRGLGGHGYAYNDNDALLEELKASILEQMGSGGSGGSGGNGGSTNSTNGGSIVFTESFLTSKFGKEISELLMASGTFNTLTGSMSASTSIVFDIINDSDENGKSESGGGKTTMEIQNNDGEWVDVYSVKAEDITKDSKTRIRVLLNPNSKQSNTLQKATNIVIHELTAHGAGFMYMSSILHNYSPSEFVQFRTNGLYVYYADPSKNDIRYNGYFNSNVQHAVLGAGLNGYYKAIRAEVNAILSKLGKLLLPDDVGKYQAETRRVQAAFKNLNQITKLGIYGPQ